MKIRLWTLGFIDREKITNSILPTPEHVRQVKKTLKDELHRARESGEDELDIVWGPELSVAAIEVDKKAMDYLLTMNEKGSLQLESLNTEVNNGSNPQTV